MKGRLRKTKDAGSRAACLAMANKLALSAQDHWRRVNAPHLVALVRAGIKFKDGTQVDINRKHNETQLHDQAIEELAT